MSIDAAFTSFPCLTTERLQLRQIRPSDAEELYAILSDEEAMKYYGHLPHRTLADTYELIDKIQERYAQRTAIRWGIAFKGQDRLIGTCGFHHPDTGFHCAETGYELDRAFWRQGIMREAMRAILRYGFEELGLHRIEAIIDIKNVASKQLLLKLGFTYEGVLRERYYLNGVFEDEHYFGLLRDEWRKLTLQ
ncbi:N-acetyltransferase [Ktedonosporobacter rubrisoli]|uniref:N-acetyltransferase n=1 Tax=Ktedonosporobacter rubrisoli TaxID=2509675 RepID=A0A4P6JWB0_KTERU|nr:GNAT family protein [Ktedonosporobacter rubrisoli]QBD79854.1 N-acetyltransferase [Ktedonosporobacter rubrisoli]